MKYFRRKNRVPLLTLSVALFLIATVGVHIVYGQNSSGAPNLIPGISIGPGEVFDTIAQYSGYLFALAGETFLSIMATAVGLSGLFLNEAVNATIIDMGVNVRKIGAIDLAWTAFRDLANIGLIFMLITIGIATILRIEQYGVRKLLAKLIIIALLLNFSLFFTKFVVDASNLLALQFWSQVTPAKDDIDGGLSDAFMQPLQLSTLYKIDTGGKEIFPDESKETQAEQIRNRTAEEGITYGKVLAVAVFGSLLFLVAAFVFFAAAVLLVVRFVVLILLMILSPLAFVAMAIPATATMAGNWWKSLVHHSIFAPAFFALVWVSLTILQSPAFREALVKDQEFAGAGFADFILNQGNVAFIFLQFMIVIVLLVASLVLARQLGIRGAETVYGWGNSLRKLGQSYIWRGTRGVARATGVPQWFHRRAAGAASAIDEYGTTPTTRNTLSGQLVQRLLDTRIIGTGARKGLQNVRRSYSTALERDQKALEGLRGGELSRRLASGKLNDHDFLLAMRQRIAADDIDELTIEQIQRFKSLVSSAGMGTLNYRRLRPDAAGDGNPIETDANGNLTAGGQAALAGMEEEIRGNMQRVKENTIPDWHRERITSLYEDNGQYKGGSLAAAREIQRMTLQAMYEHLDGAAVARLLSRGGQNSTEYLRYATNRVSQETGQPVTTRDQGYLQQLASHLREINRVRVEQQGMDENSDIVTRTESAARYLESSAAERIAGPPRPQNNNQGPNRPGPGHNNPPPDGPSDGPSGGGATSPPPPPDDDTPPEGGGQTPPPEGGGTPNDSGTAPPPSPSPDNRGTTAQNDTPVEGVSADELRAVVRDTGETIIGDVQKQFKTVRGDIARGQQEDQTRARNVIEAADRFSRRGAQAQAEVAGDLKEEVSGVKKAQEEEQLQDEAQRKAANRQEQQVRRDIDASEEPFRDAA